MALVWGSNFPITKSAVDAIHPFAFNAVRISLAVAFLAVLILRRERHELARLWHSGELNWKTLAWIGLVGHLVYQVAFIIGISLSSSGNAALLISTAPVWVIVVATLTKVEMSPPAVWIGVGLTVVGAMIIALSGSDVNFRSATLQGDFLLIAAAVSWGTFTVVSKPVLRTLSPNIFTFLTLIIALPFLIGIGIPSASQVDWAAQPLVVWYSIFHAGVLSIGVAYVLWNKSITIIGAGQTAVFANLVPVAALIFGWVLRGDIITVSQYVGGAIILAGLVIARKNRSRLDA